MRTQLNGSGTEAREWPYRAYAMRRRDRRAAMFRASKGERYCPGCGAVISARADACKECREVRRKRDSRLKKIQNLEAHTGKDSCDE